MEKAIVVIELKGFSKMATDLSHRMDNISVTPEGIRGVMHDKINKVILKATEHFDFLENKTIGGDTWYLCLNNYQEAIDFGIYFMRIIQNCVLVDGLFYLKPSMCINWGNPKLSGDSFRDDDSINAYNVADNGEPFSIYLLNNSTRNRKYIDLPELNEKLKALDEIEIVELDWREEEIGINVVGNLVKHSSTSFLYDNEIKFYNSNQGVIDNFSKIQFESKTVYAFGGPVPMTNGIYKKYLDSIFRLLNEEDCKCSVITYVDLNFNKLNTCFWLNICKYFVENYPSKFAFCIYEINYKSVKPLSYHIYNDELVHIGLRNYSTFEDSVVLDSSIMIKNKMISERFINEFLENFRKLGKLNVLEISKIISEIDLSKEERSDIDKELEEYLIMAK